MLYLSDVNSAVALTLISRPLSWTEIFIRPALKKKPPADDFFVSCFLFCRVKHLRILLLRPFVPSSAKKYFPSDKKEVPQARHFPHSKTDLRSSFFSCFFFEGKSISLFRVPKFQRPKRDPEILFFFGGGGKKECGMNKKRVGFFFEEAPKIMGARNCPRKFPKNIYVSK